MQHLLAYADWIMIASGLLTATMVQAAIAPRAVLLSMFGETLEGPLAEVVVRNWAALITLVGLSLIYAGWTSTLVVPVLIVAGASKLVFIGLVLSQGQRFLRRQAGLAVLVDTVFVILFGLVLLASLS